MEIRGFQRPLDQMLIEDVVGPQVVAVHWVLVCRISKFVEK